MVRDDIYDAMAVCMVSLLTSLLYCYFAQAAPAKMRLRSEKHLNNITKRGLVSKPENVWRYGTNVYELVIRY